MLLHVSRRICLIDVSINILTLLAGVSRGLNRETLLLHAHLLRHADSLDDLLRLQVSHLITDTVHVRILESDNEE